MASLILLRLKPRKAGQWAKEMNNMSTNTAKLILKRHGLACFSPRELAGLLSDRYMPLPSDVLTAIKTIRSQSYVKISY